MIVFCKQTRHIAASQAFLILLMRMRKKIINKRLESNTTFLDSRAEVKELGLWKYSTNSMTNDKQILPQQPYTSTLECAQARAHSDDDDVG